MDDVLIDRLRTGLADAADGIDVGDARAALPAMHRSARRRHRRNVAVGGLLGLALAGAGAAVALTVIDGEPDSVRTVTPPTTVADDDVGADDGADDEAPTTTAATNTTVAERTAEPAEGADGGDDGAPLRIAGSTRAVTGQAIAVPSILTEPTDQFLVPWADGFLAGKIEGVTPTTPLSDELFALFPEEIQDLFPDGVGAATVEENAAIIAEAELTLQAIDVLGRHPELEAAVYGQPQYSVVKAEFSVDGESWEPVTIEVPPEVALIDGITVVADRLVVVGTPATVNNDFPAAGGIASTTDLVEWTVHVIPIDLPTEVPDLVQTFGGGDVQAVLTETGWVASVEVYAELDLEALFPEAIDANAGYGISEGPDGLRVETHDEQGEVVEETFVPWDEIGIDWDTFQQLMGHPGAGDLYTATWDGEVTAVGENIVDIRPLAGGFLGQVWDDASGITGERFSIDGRTWGPVPELLERKRVHTTFAVEDATIVVALDHASDLHVYRVADVTEPWEEIEVEGLPPAMDAGMFFDGFVGSALHGGAVVDGADPFVNEWESTVEADGFRLTIIQTRRSAGYRVVDLATSDELAAENVDLRDVDEPWDPFSDLTIDHETDTITVTDPAGGDVIATFPAGAVIDDRGRAEHEYYNTRHERRDPWLVATSDGIDWIVVDLDEVDDEFGDPRSWVAVNGSTALVDTPTGWHRYEL